MSLSNLIFNSKSLLIFLMMLGLCNFASAEQEGFELLSRNPDDGSLLYSSRFPVVTPDGRYVTFTASETKFGATGKTWLFDRVLNQLELISDLSPNLNQAALISADGCKVVFTTYEFSSSKGGLYLRDRCLSTPRTILIGDTDGTSAYIDISADGKRIVYSPSSSNDYPNNDREYGVHVLDLESNTSQCISVQQVGGAFPVGACRRATAPSISADGSRVVFFSADNLFGTNISNYGGIYLYDKNNAPHLSLIQSYSDGATMPSISPDGRYVAFQSYKSLAGEGNEPRHDVFIKDTVTGDLVIASVSSSGEVGNGESPRSQIERPSFSADGTWVLFSTGARNLTPRGGSVVARNIYTGETIDFSSSSFSPYPAISGDPLGRFVVFSNAAALDNRFNSANSTSGNIYLHDRATHCILNWAELNYPDYFAPGGQSTQFVDFFTYRYYPMTNTYLGTFSQDDHLYYLGPGTGGEAADVGSVADLIEETGCLKN